MGKFPKYQYRKRCLQKKGDTCVICGDEDVVVHHIDGDRANNDLTNLIPVCRSHHGQIHAGNPSVEPWVSCLESAPPARKWSTPNTDNGRGQIGPLYLSLDDETEQYIRRKVERRETSISAVVEELVIHYDDKRELIEKLLTEKQHLQEEVRTLEAALQSAEGDEEDHTPRHQSPVWKRVYWYIFGRGG